MVIVQHTAASRIGGAETYLLRLVGFLQERGHRVIAVAREGTPVCEALRARGVETYGWHRGGKNPLLVWRLGRLLRRERADVLHTHLFSAHSLGAKAARLASVPVVGHVHAVGEDPSHLRDVPHVVACAGGVRDDLLAHGVPATRIQVVHYGIRLADYENAPERHEARRKLGVPVESPVIAVVSSLTARKGHRFLLRAMASLAGGAIPLQPHLLLAGEGGEEAALRALAGELGLSERVHFLGFCAPEKVKDVLAACDVFALPSSREGLSIAAMEAMAMRRAVLATRIAGMPELVREGASGLLVPPEDENALALALERLLRDDNWRESLALEGRRRVELLFDDRKCFADMERVLREVAAARREQHLENSAPPAHGR